MNLGVEHNAANCCYTVVFQSINYMMRNFILSCVQNTVCVLILAMLCSRLLTNYGSVFLKVGTTGHFRL